LSVVFIVFGLFIGSSLLYWLLIRVAMMLMSSFPSWRGEIGQVLVLLFVLTLAVVVWVAYSFLIRHLGFSRLFAIVTVFTPILISGIFALVKTQTALASKTRDRAKSRERR
jgi:hypothetical protein